MSYSLKHRKERSGQALLELMIGMIAVMVLVSGLLQLAVMTSAHTDVMAEARENAATLCMIDMDSGLDILSDADYIMDWNEGKDGHRLSPDDVSTEGDPSEFLDRIVDKTAHDPSAWDLIDTLPDNRISRLHNDSLVISSFGLVKGSASETAKLDMIPAFRDLVYRGDSIEVEATTWMTLCRGVY